jgi:hypothetical protein
MAKETKDEIVEIPGKKVSWERSPEHRSIYANVMALAATPYDIQVRLGQTIARPDGASAAHLEVATLLMAPGQAKALLLILAEAVTDWERKHGPVPLPEHLAKKLKSKEQGE